MKDKKEMRPDLQDKYLSSQKIHPFSSQDTAKTLFPPSLNSDLIYEDDPRSLLCLLAINEFGPMRGRQRQTTEAGFTDLLPAGRKSFILLL
jgi:hypothetical protein